MCGVCAWYTWCVHVCAVCIHTCVHSMHMYVYTHVWYVWSKCGVYTCVWCTEIGVCVGMWYALGYIPVVVGVVYVYGMCSLCVYTYVVCGGEHGV